MIRRPLVAGNWKMHGSRASAVMLVGSIFASAIERTKVVVLPPFPYLDGLVTLFGGPCDSFGSHDLSSLAHGIER